MLSATSDSSSTVLYPCVRSPPSGHFPVRLRVSASLSDTNPINGARVEYTPSLIVGLGNLGNKHHGTRHNMIDHISRAEGILMNVTQSKALIDIGSIGEVPILLAKPQASLNYSGESVGPLAAYYQGSAERRPWPSAHHNGVKSVMSHLDGCREFPRLCIGIGNPPGTTDMKAFLLQKFSTIEREQVDVALEQGVEAVRKLVLHGFDEDINRFNIRQKYKYHKV